MLEEIYQAAIVALVGLGVLVAAWVLPPGGGGRMALEPTSRIFWTVSEDVRLACPAGFSRGTVSAPLPCLSAQGLRLWRWLDDLRRQFGLPPVECH